MDLLANLDTDAPNNSIVVFANVQTSAQVNSHVTVEFIIFAAAFEINSILPMLMWASAASAGRSVCWTVGVTIGTSSSRCNPRPRTSLLGSSIGNSSGLFKPRLVLASSGAVCMGSSDPDWRVSPLLLAASVPVLVA